MWTTNSGNNDCQFGRWADALLSGRITGLMRYWTDELLTDTLLNGCGTERMRNWTIRYGTGALPNECVTVQTYRAASADPEGTKKAVIAAWDKKKKMGRRRSVCLLPLLYAQVRARNEPSFAWHGRAASRFRLHLPCSISYQYCLWNG